MFEPYLMGQYQYPWQGMPPTPNWQPQTPQVAQGQQGIQGVRFVDGIEEAKNCTVPLGSKALLQEFYDWQRTKTMNCMAEVKVLVDSYE